MNTHAQGGALIAPFFVKNAFHPSEHQDDDLFRCSPSLYFIGIGKKVAFQGINKFRMIGYLQKGKGTGDALGGF